MKKSLFLLFAVGLLGLSACGKEGTVGLEKKGSSVLTPELIKANIELKQQEDVFISRPKLINEELFSSSSYSVQQNYGGGILRVTNVDGYVGFYSTYLGQFIINPYFSSGSITVNSLNSPMIGNVITVEDYNSSSLYVFDPFGNFFNISITKFNAFNGITTRTVYDNDGKLRVVADVNYYSSESDSYIYKDDGSAESYDGEFDNNLAPNTKPVDNNEPVRGELFKVGWMALDDFGLEGYSLVTAANGYCTIFQYNEAKSSFYLSSNAHMIGIFDKKILTQQVFSLPDEATDYTYSSGGTKYSLDSYYINIENGKTEKANINVVFQSAEPIVNQNKKVEFFEVEYSEITSKKVIGNSVKKLVDGSMAVRDDVTGCSIKNYELINYEGYEYFYNSENKVLYNSSLKPVTFLQGLNNINFAKKLGILVGTYDGKYGAVAPNGTVVIPFEYDSIFSAYGEEGKMILVKDGDAYRYENGNINSIVMDVQPVGTNLFKGYKNGSVYYFSTLANNLLVLDEVEDSGYVPSTINNVLGKYSVTTLYRNDYYNNRYYLKVFASDSMRIRSYSSDFPEKHY